MTELKANSTSIEFEKSSQFPQKNSFRHNSQNNELIRMEKNLQSLKCNNFNCKTKFSSILRVLSCKHYFCNTCFDQILLNKICAKCNKIFSNLNRENGNWEFDLDNLNKNSKN